MSLDWSVAIASNRLAVCRHIGRLYSLMQAMPFLSPRESTLPEMIWRLRVLICELVVALFGVFLLTSCETSGALDLSQSTRDIRMEILRVTPIGTESAKVKVDIRDQMKPQTFRVLDRAPGLPSRGRPGVAGPGIGDRWPLGGKHDGLTFGASLGAMRSFAAIHLTPTFVFAYWTFDEEKLLVDVYVGKQLTGF